MADPQHPDDLMSLEEAADELDVGLEQARAMMVDDLLVPSEGSGDDARFTRAAVEAVRLAGG